MRISPAHGSKTPPARSALPCTKQSVSSTRFPIGRVHGKTHTVTLTKQRWAASADLAVSRARAADRGSPASPSRQPALANECFDPAGCYSFGLAAPASLRTQANRRYSDG
jgi:hypothetical protein